MKFLIILFLASSSVGFAQTSISKRFYLIVLLESNPDLDSAELAEDELRRRTPSFTKDGHRIFEFPNVPVEYIQGLKSLEEKIASKIGAEHSESVKSNGKRKNEIVRVQFYVEESGEVTDFEFIDSWSKKNQTDVQQIIHEGEWEVGEYMGSKFRFKCELTLQVLPSKKSRKKRD